MEMKKRLYLSYKCDIIKQIKKQKRDKERNKKMCNNNHITIGIEGYVGSGKTTICRMLLSKIPQSVFLNGGNLYRSIVAVFLKQGISLETLKSQLQHTDIKDVMDQLKIELKIEEGETQFYYQGQKLSEEMLQSKDSSIAVSTIGGVADNQQLYQFGYQLIQHLQQHYHVIVSGRDLMRIDPELDYHIFITASIEERAKRKRQQYQNSMSLEEIKAHIQKRDDLQIKAGFYDLFDRTIVVDVTNCTSAEESTNLVLQHITIPKGN